MANDLVQVRAHLMQSPKVLAMARHLRRNNGFMDWLAPTDRKLAQAISDDALRCVTCALLLRVWSSAKEYGKFEGLDLVLAHISLPDIDLMANCPGVGKAMEAVGWAATRNDAVVLPNFKQHNAPLLGAEKQKAYRERKKAKEQAGTNGGEGSDAEGKEGSVTGALPKRSNAPRAGPHIDIKPPSKGSIGFRIPSLEEVRAYCKERNNSVDPAQFIDFYTSKGWKIGKNAMKDWRAAVRTWERNSDSNGVPARKKDPRGTVAAIQEYLEFPEEP